MTPEIPDDLYPRYRVMWLADFCDYNLLSFLRWLGSVFGADLEFHYRVSDRRRKSVTLKLMARTSRGILKAEIYCPPGGRVLRFRH